MPQIVDSRLYPIDYRIKRAYLHYLKRGSQKLFKEKVTSI